MLEHLGMVLKFLGRPNTTCLVFTAGRGNLKVTYPKGSTLEIDPELCARMTHVEMEKYLQQAEVVQSADGELTFRDQSGLLVAVFVDEVGRKVSVVPVDKPGVDARMEEILSQLGHTYPDIFDIMVESVSGFEGSQDVRQLVRMFFQKHSIYSRQLYSSQGWEQIMTRPTRMLNKYCERVVIDGKYLYLQMSTIAEEPTPELRDSGKELVPA